MTATKIPPSTTPPQADPDHLLSEHDEEVDHRIEDVEQNMRGLELREGLAIVLSLFVLAAVIGLAVLLVGWNGGESGTDSAQPAAASREAPASDDHADSTHAATAAVPAAAVEPYERPDPTLPAVPDGAVKRFKIDVFEHVTRVAADKPPTRVWSFGVNGVLHRGTGVSTPMVVEQGDKVEIELVNGGSKEMDVKFPHSIDFHSSEVAPNEAFKSIGPGETHEFSFVAKHPGVFMYHCATDPVLMHTGAGMVGMMIVKPKNLPPADKELWLTQQEFYLGARGGDADMEKMAAKEPDVIAFNGFANQYKEKPIAVERGERVRMYVLNAGPSIWSAFHVIGTVFDRTVVEGVVGRHAQTVNLAPSQGGIVEFTLDEEGAYPFVTHAFGDMVKGSVGVLATANAAAGEGMKH
jgi:nitrite reductase (NO-forming)